MNSPLLRYKRVDETKIFMALVKSSFKQLAGRELFWVHCLDGVPSPVYPRGSVVSCDLVLWLGAALGPV